ncbi:MAG TPA: hypothetical protein VJ301_11675 [Propionibacteriaceae bacterium]|nr:hypothetical protein [Propionibacteriaceae bacterium]
MGAIHAGLAESTAAAPVAGAGGLGPAVMETDEPDLPPCDHPETVEESGWVICLDCGHRWIKQEEK